MKILRNYLDNNIVINNEVDFHADAGWEESLADFEKEVLYDIINPIENYETVRYIHQPYTSTTNVEQTDLWYKFYFLTTGINREYVQDYTATGITLEENIKHLEQFYKSFFRLEFYKTPHILDVSGNTIGYEPPTRINRKMVFAKNLPVTTSMKYFYLNQNDTVHVPVFFGSNYVNKENMYQFWFQDETVLNETNLSGTTTGNTFFMTAKFYNAKDGSIIDFTNDDFCSTHEITEQNDMYFQVDFKKSDHSYQIFNYNGTKGNRVGQSNSPILFYEKGGKTNCVTPTPTTTPTPTVTPTHNPLEITPTPTRTSDVTPTITPTQTKLPRYYLQLQMCGTATPPGTNTGWTINNYLQSECQIGDIFDSGSGEMTGFYQVINYSLTSQGGTIPGSKNTRGYHSCADTPAGQYVAPVYRTAHINLFRYSGYTSYTQIQSGMCGKDPSQFPSGFVSGGAYADATVTGTTLTPGVLYDLYLDHTDGTPKWSSSGSYWWGAVVYNTHSQVDYIVRIENGTITEWRDCSSGNIIYS